MRPLRNRKRLIKGTVAGVAGVAFAGVAVSWFVAGALVAPSPRTVGAPPADLNAVSISFESESGSLVSGWHVRSELNNGVIVLLHGIRSTRLSMLERARILHDAGYSTVMIDFQAHGESPGDAITVGFLEKHDVRAAVQFARAEHPDEPIAVVGVSLGGAATLLASPLDIDAVVLESVYPNIADAIHNRVAARLGPLAWLPESLLLIQLRPRLGISPSELRPIDHIDGVGCPVCVVSGTDDQHTTESETRSLYSAALEPKSLWLVEGAAHVDLLEHDPKGYRQNVLSFLDHHLRDETNEVGGTRKLEDTRSAVFETVHLQTPISDRVSINSH